MTDDTRLERLAQLSTSLHTSVPPIWCSKIPVSDIEEVSTPRLIDLLVHDPTVHTLFRRCVQCPPEAPACRPCAVDETCQLNSQSCDSCAATSCVKMGQLPGQLVEKPETPIGPIIGGVVGGVVAVAVATFLIWWFCVRPKRKAAAVAWDPPEKRDQSTLARSARQSAAHSIASTVLSRASNVIPIAYIPGVTVRSPPESPGIPPPMPGFPSSNVSTPGPEQHFFMPNDLRDSTWSDTSSIDPRISLAPSLVRSTFYGDNAVVPPVPAVQAFRAQANVVSVKSGITTPSGLSTNTRLPAIPQGPKLGSSNSSIVAKTVTARPIEIRKASSGPRIPTLGNLAKASAPKKSESRSASEKSVPVFFDEKDVVDDKKEELEDSPISPLVKPKPSFATFSSARSSSVSAILPLDGPLGGTSTTVHRHSKSEGLNAMIEEAINRARDPHMSVRPELRKQESGPFSDQHEIKENLL